MIGQILQNASLLLIVALGGLIGERSGILDIGLEGKIAVGAFAATAASLAGGGAGLSLVAGVSAGLLFAALFALAVLRWQANPFIVGLAINVLAAGAVPLLSELLFETRGSLRPQAVQLASGTVVVAAVAVLSAAHIFLYHTVAGMRLRIAGAQPQWLEANGVRPARYRLQGLLAAGAASGLAGALLALRLGVYLPNISAGRGWIALVIIYLGYRTPGGLAVAALFFGAMDALAVRAQAVVGMPPTVLLALPYLLTVAAFVSYAALRRQRR